MSAVSPIGDVAPTGEPAVEFAVALLEVLGIDPATVTDVRLLARAGLPGPEVTVTLLLDQPQQDHVLTLARRYRLVER